MKTHTLLAIDATIATFNQRFAFQAITQDAARRGSVFQDATIRHHSSGGTALLAVLADAGIVARR